MSAQPKLQPDDFERMKRILEDAPRGYDFLAHYVRELELHRQEEDIFIRLASRNVSPGRAFRVRDRFVVGVVSGLYEHLDAEQQQRIRQWWRENVRREANQFHELKTRLSSLT